MDSAELLEIRLLELDDVESWLDLCQILDAESGEDSIYYGPYSRNEPFSVDEIRKKTIKLWSEKLTVPSWRRAWGVFDSDRIIGSAQIAAGDLPSSVHRVDLGIEIYKEYRKLGIGQRLFHVIIEWCKQESSVSWIDLGVFSGNDFAKNVFKKVGFVETGYREDAWRMDGCCIDETLMSLCVK